MKSTSQRKKDPTKQKNRYKYICKVFNFHFHRRCKMSEITLKKLQNAWKKLDEEASYKDVGGIKPVPGYGDKEVKAVTDLPGRDEGAKGTDKEQKSGFTGNDKAVEGSNVKPVTRGEGAKEGAKEVGDEHGTDKKPEGSTVKPVDRSEGSVGAPKEYNQDFRNRIKSALGLPLNDKLNQTGKGLNK